MSDRKIEMMEKGINENDQLAWMTASLIDADSVLFLTDVGGVYEADPRIKPQARRYKEINARAIQDLIHSLSDASQNGAGGMKAKLLAARQCFDAGMRTAIAGIDDENVIVDFGRGKPVGTMMGASVRFK